MSIDFRETPTPPQNGEIVDLRNSPLNTHGNLLAYDHLSLKQTDSLEIGTQQKLIDAAKEANWAEYPLNTLLTIRLSLIHI